MIKDETQCTTEKVLGPPPAPLPTRIFFRLGSLGASISCRGRALRLQWNCSSLELARRVEGNTGPTWDLACLMISSFSTAIQYHAGL